MEKERKEKLQNRHGPSTGVSKSGRHNRRRLGCALGDICCAHGTCMQGKAPIWRENAIKCDIDPKARWS